MSKFDRVDVRTLGSCCISAVHQLIELASEGTQLGCAGCGSRIIYHGGRWTR